MASNIARTIRHRNDVLKDSMSDFVKRLLRVDLLDLARANSENTTDLISLKAKSLGANDTS